MQGSKPVAAAIDGYAIGVVPKMALPCDVRIAAEDAQLSIRFVKVGLAPELGSTRPLALVTAVTAPDRPIETAIEQAEELANNPTPVVTLINELLAANPLEPSLDAVREREQVRGGVARR